MAEIKQHHPIGTQPRGTVPMHVGGNRNATNRPVGHDGKRDWSFGFCDCFGDCGTCVMSWCCPCIVFGQNKERMRSLTTHGAPLRGGGSMFNSDCFVYCCLDALAGFGWVMQIGSRGEIRDRYGIRGGALGDCCRVACCRPCALTQERREIELEEHSF